MFALFWLKGPSDMVPLVQQQVNNHNHLENQSTDKLISLAVSLLADTRIGIFIVAFDGQ